MNWMSCLPPDIAVFVLPVYSSKSLFNIFANSCPGDFAASETSLNGLFSLWSFSWALSVGATAPSVIYCATLTLLSFNSLSFHVVVLSFFHVVVLDLHQDCCGGFFAFQIKPVVIHY